MRRRHCRKKTKKKYGSLSTHNMPIRKKFFRDKISGTSRRLTSNTSRKTRKLPEALSPASNIYSKISRIESPMTIKKQNHTTVFSLRPITKPKKNKLGPYEGLYKCWGLSPKEKMQIIGNCQSRLARYLQLKKIAADAIKSNKIFSVYGSCKTVRNAMVERGWVEKLLAHRMNMNNIRSGCMSNLEIRNEFETLLLSHLVEKHAPSFIWRTKEHQTDDIIDISADYVPTVNKLQIDAAWTTKQGLCATMKRNYWFYIEDVAEVFCPRTYNSCDASEIDSFRNDFKITACTSLLKWVLSMVANHRPVFVSNGTVSINVILFAVNRCKEYIYRKQNKDIDKTLSNVSPGQWNTFMKNYYLIISKAEHFTMDKDKQLPLYLGYAKLLLKEIHKYRPQLSCEGCHNIWIIKPAHCCRGRGIKLASKLEVVSKVLSKAKAKYVVQKYIEEPLLIHDTKFDIRQYYLITSTCPLVIWMYKDCYLKFSSQKYNLKNYHESIHLTNNAVQKKYKNCENRHKELPLNNMWDLDKYMSYLKKNGNENVWDSIIYPGMRKAITSIVLGCQDSMVPCKNRFELYGCDFLLDKDYKPWLIEINSCPDLNHTTPVTAKICPAVINDIIKVVIDYAQNSSSSTGKFECIYRQPFTIPRYLSASVDLVVHGYSLPASYFYKGKLELKDPLISVDNQLDITAAMKTMKTIYDKRAPNEHSPELPVLPESDSQCWMSSCPSPTRIENQPSDINQVVSDPAKKIKKTIYDTHAPSEDSPELPVLLESDSQCWMSRCLSPTRIENRLSDVIQVVSDPAMKMKKTIYDKYAHNEDRPELPVLPESDSQCWMPRCPSPTRIENRLSDVIQVVSDPAMKMKKTIYDKYARNEDSPELPVLLESDNQCWMSRSPSPTRIEDRLSDIIQVVSDLNIETESNHNDISNKSSESTNEECLEILTVDSGEESWVDLTPLENGLLDLSPSTEKLNPLVHYDGTKLSSFNESKSEYQKLAAQAVFNLLDFLNRKEKEYNMNEGKFKGR